MDVSIKGLDRAAVLAALYNASRPQGMGFLQYDPKPMSLDEARNIIDSGQTNFDYLKGRVMKLSLDSGDSVNTRLYDRDNGAGAGERAIDSLRKSGSPASPDIREAHGKGVLAAAVKAEEGMRAQATVSGHTIHMTLEDVKGDLAPAVRKAVGSRN